MRIRIYNETWTVTEVTQERLQELMEDKTDDFTYWGLCQQFHNEIYLLKELGPQRKKAVLYHEVTHAITAIECGKDGKYSEEDLCNFIGQHFAELNNVVKEYFKPKPKRKPKKIDEKTNGDSIHRDTPST